MKTKKMEYFPIGYIQTPWEKPENMPIQPAGAKEAKGVITINKDYQEGLKDIDGFSHIILLFHFHLTNKYELRVVPYMGTKEHGVFATRSPKRPNHIGLSIVKLDRVEDNKLFVSEIDLIDGTPILDIKPFFEKFDNRNNTRQGWLQKVSLEDIQNLRSDNRFHK